MKHQTEKWRKKVCRASLTVEAAVTIGMFCFCIGCILLLFPFLEKEIAATRVMYEVCEHAELVSALEPEVTQETALTESYAKWVLRSKASGMGFYAQKEGDGTLYSAEYQMPVPFGILSEGLIFRQTMFIRHWTGYDRSEESEEELVYITKTGTVYHRSIQCKHLQVSVREVAFRDISRYRNQSGGKYYPCEYCVKNSCGNKVYITPEGDRYHSTRSCSSLLRFIRQVKISEVEDTHRPCKSCYVQSGGE